MGRPSVPILSTDRIARAAMDLVNATGGFTIPDLARKLKVSPSSLYNHVTGREQIVELLREMAMNEVELPALGGPWPAVVADIMRSYRRSYARYPRLIPLMTAYPVSSRIRARRDPAHHHPHRQLRARLGARCRRARNSLGHKPRRGSRVRRRTGDRRQPARPRRAGGLEGVVLQPGLPGRGRPGLPHSASRPRRRPPAGPGRGAGSHRGRQGPGAQAAREDPRRRGRSPGRRARHCRLSPLRHDGPPTWCSTRLSSGCGRHL